MYDTRPLCHCCVLEIFQDAWIRYNRLHWRTVEDNYRCLDLVKKMFCVSGYIVGTLLTLGLVYENSDMRVPLWLFTRY